MTVIFSLNEWYIANEAARLRVKYTICRDGRDLMSDKEREATMKFTPRKYPCADTRCTNQTDRPNTLCKPCLERERAEWRALHVPKHDPKRHKP